MNFYDNLRAHQQLIIEYVGRALLTIGLIALVSYWVMGFGLPATHQLTHGAASSQPWTQGADNAWTWSCSHRTGICAYEIVGESQCHNDTRDCARATRRSLRLMRGRYYVPHYTVSP